MMAEKGPRFTASRTADIIDSFLLENIKVTFRHKVTPLKLIT